MQTFSFNQKVYPVSMSSDLPNHHPCIHPNLACNSAPDKWEDNLRTQYSGLDKLQIQNSKKDMSKLYLI